MFVLLMIVFLALWVLYDYTHKRDDNDDDDDGTPGTWSFV